MPWLRSGDNAATYPPLLAAGLATDADERTLNELGGWLWRCAMQSAGHLTDGRIDAGTAYLMGGSRTQALVAAALEVGLLTVVEGSRPPVWQIVDDPEFLHIRSRSSVEFDRQRDRDRRNPELTGPVRLRDGDACRYCGQVVNFRARTGGRSGTYDHTVPGEPASVATYVVACRTHNSAMREGDRLELLPPPARPFYHPATIEWLAEHGLTPPGDHRREPAPAAEGLTPGGHRTEPARVRPAGGPPPRRVDAPGRTTQEPPGTQAGSRDGTGRDGTGGGGAGRGGAGRGGAGSPAPPPASSPGPRRGRRRGRRGGGDR